MYRNFYSLNDMPRPKGLSEKPAAPAKEVHKEKPEKPLGTGLGAKLETDDIILIAVAILLFAGECDDNLLILAIVFIFLSRNE